MNPYLIVFLFLFLLFESCSSSSKRKEMQNNEVTDTSGIIDRNVIIDNEQVNPNYYAEKVERRKSEIKSHFNNLNFNDRPISYYLDHPDIDSIVLKFCKGEIYPTDDDITFQLLEVLTKKNNELTAFYFHCMDLICLDSDGALSEGMGFYGQRFIINNPLFSLENFSRSCMRLVESDFAFTPNWEDQFSAFSDSFRMEINGKLDSNKIDYFLKEIKMNILQNIEDSEN